MPTQAILDEGVCISLCANTLGICMNPSFFFLSTGKVVGQNEFLSLGTTTNLGEGKLCIKTSFTLLKN